jgi:putative phosphoesterase
MRTALISDLHANAVALDAVLADAAATGYDQLVCLGDVATLGPRPREVLARLRDLACRCVLGNHDEYLLEPELGSSQPAIIIASEAATRDELSTQDFELLRSFARTIDDGDLVLFHGTPRSHSEDLLATTPAERVDEMLAPRQARVFAGGHTHLQMLRQHRGMLVVNPGSVGMPFREYAFPRPPIVLPHAEYAIVDILRDRVSVDLRRIQLDPRRLRDALDDWDNPLAEPLRRTYSA